MPIELGRRLEIVRVKVDECVGHQAPCKGCTDYCELYREGEEGMVAEAYGVDHCCGETWYHEYTIWKCTISYKVEEPYVAGSVAGLSQEPAAAERDAEAMLAAIAFIQQDRDPW